MNQFVFRILSTVVFSTVTLVSFSIWSASKSNDFGREEQNERAMKNSELAKNIILSGEVFFFDEKGRLLQKAGELRHWRSGGSKLFLESNWFYTHNLLKNPLAFHHLWTLDKFGRLTAVIKQYENMKRGKREVLRTGLVREKKYELKLFETINWKVPAKNGYAVVRFTPNLIEQKVSRKLSQFPVMGESMMISDNRGNLWADYVTVNGEFVGIRTHQGTLYLSYRPFDGAKEVGTVSGSEMLLNFDKKLRLKIRSKGEFIPGGLEAPVYAFIKNKERSESPHSVRTSVADSATEVIDRLKLHN